MQQPTPQKQNPPPAERVDRPSSGSVQEGRRRAEDEAARRAAEDEDAKRRQREADEDARRRLKEAEEDSSAGCHCSGATEVEIKGKR